MDFTGKIIFALPAKSGLKKNGESWKSQEFVIENTEGQYPKKMCFNVFGEDKIKSFDIKLGEELKVSFDIDAKQWQDRWFNSINAWKVEKVGAPSNNETQSNTSTATSPKNGDDSSLPF